MPRYSNCLLRGQVKLKKIKKSEKNSDWPDFTHPTPYPSFFLKHVQQQKTTQKLKISKKKSELEFDQPTHFRVFLGFLNFLTRQNPLKSMQLLPFGFVRQNCIITMITGVPSPMSLICYSANVASLICIRSTN